VYDNFVFHSIHHLLTKSYLSLSGFGLPHTDENPYNKNLNDCLDYTDNPSSNVLPGEVNMIKLQEVYLATEREKRLLRRVENKDGSVTETIGWMINEDEAEASSL